VAGSKQSRTPVATHRRCIAHHACAHCCTRLAMRLKCLHVFNQNIQHRSAHQPACQDKSCNHALLLEHSASLMKIRHIERQ
jgi:hypothetical protein